MTSRNNRWRVETFMREEFRRNRWRYENGQHATFIGRTRCGKSRLGLDLLDVTATEKLPVWMLIKKARDKLIRGRIAEHGYLTTEHWPPTAWAKMKHGKTSGVALWPPTKFDNKIDRPVKSAEFRRAILDAYKRGNKILFIDDTYGVSKILGLENDLIELWTEGGGMGAGMWALFQRAAGVPLWAYSQAEHVFLFKEPDKRGRDRFADIGGVDPDMVKDINVNLRHFQSLYIGRAGGIGGEPSMCIIDGS